MTLLISVFEIFAAPVWAQAGNPERREGGVLSFAQAISQALSRNPDALTAQVEIARARALVQEARSYSLPTIAGQLSYTRLPGDKVLDGSLIAARDTLAASAALMVPLVAPVQWAQWSHARDDLVTAQADAAAVNRAVAVATARAYLSVLTQRRLLAISGVSRDTAKAHHDYAATRSRGGLGTRLDEVRALDELRSEEAGVELAELAATRAREALGVLLGDVQAIDVQEDVTLATPPPAEAISEEELRARPDLMALLRKKAAALAVLSDSWRDYLPTLIGSLGGALQTPETALNPNVGWQAQLALALPIYDGGFRYAKKRVRRAVVDKAELALDNALRSAQSEVRVAYAALARAERALALTTEAAAAAGETLGLATQAYRGGAVSSLEVIDAERRFRAASVDVAIAQDSVRQARIDVLAAVGLFP
jgi:outer membrane protein TolC